MFQVKVECTIDKKNPSAKIGLVSAKLVKEDGMLLWQHVCVSKTEG